jgi:hypothetical protein
MGGSIRLELVAALDRNTHIFTQIISHSGFRTISRHFDGIYQMLALCA